MVRGGETVSAWIRRMTRKTASWTITMKTGGKDGILDRQSESSQNADQGQKDGKQHHPGQAAVISRALAPGRTRSAEARKIPTDLMATKRTAVNAMKNT